MKEIHFASIPSTNTYLKESYASLEDMTFVSAAYQSQGKGRQDRVWEASKGENLLFSILLKRPDLSDQAGFFSLIAATSVCKVLEDYGLSQVTIKWPNDVYVSGKKIAGILLEGQLPEYLVIGIGVNVNQTQFPTGLRHPATSLSLALGKQIDLDDFKRKIYAGLEESLANSALTNRFLDYYSTHDYLQGKTVSINDLSGEYLGVGKDFSLRLKTSTGIREIVSGEVFLLR